MILAGGGVQISDTAEMVTELARKLNVPVVCSLLGKDAFPNEDSLYAGYIGAYGNQAC